MEHKQKRQTEETSIMTAKEVAEYLRLSHKTVITRATRGEIPGRQIGSQWRFARKTIEQFV